MSATEGKIAFNVFEHFDGEKFTVRGIKGNYGDKTPTRNSTVSTTSNEFKLKSILNVPSASSTSSKASQTLRGKSSALHRLSKINLSIRPDRGKLSTLILDPQTEKNLKTLFSHQEYWVARKKTFNDTADISEHPSYTIKNVAYNLECELLYMEAKEKYDSQFLREMRKIISSKQKIRDQLFTQRLFSYATLWPPLHTRAELDIFNRRFFQLSQTERKRLDYLMNTPLSEI